MRRGLAGALGLVAVFSVSCAQADTDALGSVTRSLRAGDTQMALREISSLPTDGDVRARFLRGTTLAAAGRVKEAIKIFQGLIEDHPKLPEPYNNLAALYARENRLDKAKAVLERAIRTDESYATVYENLSAIYVEMARDSYVKALRLDDNRRPLNLQLLYALHAEAGQGPRTGGKKSEPARAARAVAPARTATAEVRQAAPAAPKTEAIGKAPAQHASEADRTEAPSESPIVKTSEPATAEAPSPKPVKVSLRKKAAGKPAAKGPAEEKPSETRSAETSQTVAKAADAGGAVPESSAQVRAPSLQVTIRKTLTAWAEAWSTQQVDQYLAHYVADFRPSTGQTHESWVAERRQRLSKPDKISISLDEFDIRQHSPNEVVVRLWQHYRSDRYQDKTRKKFVLLRTDGNWLIESERSLKIVR